MKAPNIFSGVGNGPIPVPKPAPLDLKTSNSHLLIDHMCVAAQWQLFASPQKNRRAWRKRYAECYAELRSRTAPKGVI